ncbi:MAG TPA: LamG-like jellyroll fold domain-containing protein [Rhodanobacteraceae bacterium]|nr:LamG-like jellyroll fold domain-containing protein [Rhodanobacteraceae bacterium]
MATITDNNSHPEQRDATRALRDELANLSLGGVADSMRASRYAVSAVDGGNVPTLVGAQVGGNTGTGGLPRPVQIVGRDSVQVAQTANLATVQLVGDSATPAKGAIYGASTAGALGYQAISTLVSAGTNITVTANADGSITISSSGGGGGSSNYLVPPFADVSSLLHFNGTNGSTTFTDQVAGNTWTANNATISTAQSLFGGGSGLFTGASNSAIVMPTSSKFNVGTNPWTLEFSIYPNGTHQVSARLFQTRNGDFYGAIAVLYVSGQTFSVYQSTNGSSWAVSNAAAFTLTLGQWNRVLIQFTGTAIQSYVNGFLVGTYNVTGLTPYYNSADSIIIGGQTVGTSRSINAYVDEFRFTNGLALVSVYPPLTSEFPNS